MKDLLAIFLITYNRKDFLKRTLDEILAESSPVKDYSLTVLDNASTDGTSELLEEYCVVHPNMTHIRHKVNIGGNANICRAFEMGAASGKKYVWVLADDDRYDFSQWSQVEDAAKADSDVICVANYIFPTPESRSGIPHQLLQLTFVPAGIYKTELITNSVLMAMYDAIYTMFSQSCLAIYAIENHRRVHVCENAVVFNGLHFENHVSNNSYTRGSSNKFVLARRRDTTWILGYSNVLSLLSDEQTKFLCMQAAINYKDICRKETDLLDYLDNLKKNAPNYFLEVYNLLPSDVQSHYRNKSFLRRFSDFLPNIVGITNEYVGKKKIKKFTLLGMTFKKEWK